MEIEHISHWVEGLLPGSADFHQVKNFTLADFSVGEESIACTVDFSRVDTGVVTHDSGVETEVRCEILALARASVSVPNRAVEVAANMLFDASTNTPPMPAQPGQLLPAIGIMAGFPQEGLTVHHGFLAEPRIWGPQVPFLKEDSPHPQLIMPLQLIPLTDEEFLIAHSQGTAALVHYFSENQVDILDWKR